MPHPGDSAAATYLSSELPLAIAHRGGAGENPENTVAAFRAAHALGFRYLETDVHLTADGVVVAFHDPDLDRVTDVRGRIRDLRWDEVAAATVGGVGGIPRLGDLFDEFPDARFNIDAKSNAVVEPLLEVIAVHGATDRVCVASFSHRRIRRVRELGGPMLCTSASQLGIIASVLRGYGIPVPPTTAPALQAPPRFLGIPVVTRRFVDRAQRDGLAVHVWTIDEPAEIVELLDLGVDGIMTDEPAVLKQVFEARGIWTE